MKRSRPRVSDRALKRRVARAVERVHAAAVRAVGEDVEPRRLRSGLMWIFAYLLGGEIAHLTYASRGEHQPVEVAADRAIASGIQAYAECLRQEGPPADEWLAVLLGEIADRVGGARRKGRPGLQLVREQEPLADDGDADDEAIPF
jgi:hypothetical protein